MTTENAASAAVEIDSDIDLPVEKLDWISVEDVEEGLGE